MTESRIADFSDQLKQRTKQFALRSIALCRALPRTAEGRVIGNQLLRSATSVGANYRSACRARSIAEFTSKISIVLEEADETGYWLELLVDSGTMSRTRLQALMHECEELTRLFSAIRHKSRSSHIQNSKLTIHN